MGEDKINIPYTAILQQVGQQLGVRKKDLLIRSLLMVWPLAVVVCYFFYLYNNEQKLQAFIDTLNTQNLPI